MARGTEGTAAAVAESYDFSNVRTVVDVAGGLGALVAAILSAHEHLTGILFDLPIVIADAPANLESKGVADRCELVGGDLFESVPSGGDTYLLKSILHDWDDERCHTILANVRKVIRPDGRLLIVEGLMPERLDESTYLAHGDLLMMALTLGKERTEAEYRALFAAAEFELSRTIELDAPSHTISSKGRRCDAGVHLRCRPFIVNPNRRKNRGY